MCRSIRDLRHQPTTPMPPDIEAAARQYVRKISGYRTPPRKHAEAFEAAVVAVAVATANLLATVRPVVEVADVMDKSA